MSPALLCTAALTPVRAQPQPGVRPAGSPSSGSTSIVVTGQRPAAQSSIDRKTYTIGRDLQSTAGSAADVLRNLPSVDVDAQGNVSLRGDQNVQILIDSKPSTSVNSANRGETLEQLPANAIYQIEVITNPSAQYRPDGKAGLINIITKGSRKSRSSGSFVASAGSDGRRSLAVSGTYVAGPLSISGGLTVKRDVPRRSLRDRRSRLDPVAQRPVDSAQDSLFVSKRLVRIANLGLDYDLTPADRLSANGSYNLRTGKPRVTEHDLIGDPAGGPATEFERTGIGTERQADTEASFRYRHAFGPDGHDLTIEVRRGESAKTQARTYTTLFQSPPEAVTIDEERPDGDEKERELSADYVRPLGGKDKLQLGYDLQRDDDEYRDVEGPVDPATGRFTSNLSLTNDFRFARTIHALYATVDGHFGKRFSYIAGLRFEDEIDDTDLVTTGDHSKVDDFHAYPTLHTQYKLTSSQQLRFSYSHRVARPEAEDLNPFPVFGDPQSLREGNPHLRPEQTDSFEAGYEIDHSGTVWQATIYLRQTHDAFSTVSRLVSPNVLLTTRENLGKSTAGGLELTGSGALLKGLKYGLSGDIFYNRIDASNLGVLGTRSTISFAAKASIDLQATRRDQLQVSANYSGKRPTPQGYRLPSASINLGLRHQIRDDLAAVATVSDLLDRQRDRLVIDTSNFHDETTFRRSNRTAVLALTWTFAGQRKTAKQPQFDYSSDGGAGSP